MSELTLQRIATYSGDFPTKFGIPRQSGLAPSARGTIVFEPAFRDVNALRGIEGFSHLWLLWGFSAIEKRDAFSPMVKPPRLGGNRRMGVFATRSPFRPNPIGLSTVRLLGTEARPRVGTVLLVAGADLMDGTPIYDIKPYLPFADSHPNAVGGFSDAHLGDTLEVAFPNELLKRIPKEKRAALCEALSADPRPAYRDDPEELFGFWYAGWDVRFTVEDGVLTVRELVSAREGEPWQEGKTKN